MQEYFQHIQLFSAGSKQVAFVPLVFNFHHIFFISPYLVKFMKFSCLFRLRKVFFNISESQKRRGKPQRSAMICVQSTSSQKSSLIREVNIINLKRSPCFCALVSKKKKNPKRQMKPKQLMQSQQR